MPRSLSLRKALRSCRFTRRVLLVLCDEVTKEFLTKTSGTAAVVTVALTLRSHGASL